MNAVLEKTMLDRLHYLDETLAAAIHWYQRGTLSQERAAELAGLNRRDFIRALAREGVDVFNLDQDSLARELA